MSNEIALSAVTRSSIIDAVRADGKADKVWRKSADSLHADGFRASMLETEKNGGDVALRAALKMIIASGLTDAERKMIDADVKTLDGVQKLERNNAKDKVEKYLVKIRNYLKADEAEAAGDTGDAKETKTEMQRIQKMLDDALTKIQKLDAPAFNVVDVVKLIKTAKGAMPSV